MPPGAKEREAWTRATRARSREARRVRPTRWWSTAPRTAKSNRPASRSTTSASRIEPRWVAADPIAGLLEVARAHVDARQPVHPGRLPQVGQDVPAPQPMSTSVLSSLRSLRIHSAVTAKRPASYSGVQVSKYASVSLSFAPAVSPVTV